LFHISLSRNVVDDCILGRIFGFGLHRRRSARARQERHAVVPSANLFELIDQLGRVPHDFIVGSMELFREDLVDDPVLAWGDSQLG